MHIDLGDTSIMLSIALISYYSITSLIFLKISQCFTQFSGEALSNKIVKNIYE